ncbi:MAG: aminotransferase class III-fold pyridoxal phosphate-dependent enzyme, partial [Pseudomonadota bacterium]|nr:aminotransferase class III-fold pyridoxal phosphate-dependent enzyme [Pseudomonadota bacterium]
MTHSPSPNDFSRFWMPFSANRDFARDPRLITAADGMYYTSSDGRQILDATAGLWCVNAGHGDPIIKEALKRQIDTLDYAPHFNFGTPAAFELAGQVAALFPKGLEHVFFTGSGSESVDT